MWTCLLILCRSNCKHLVINPSYHNSIMFAFDLLPYNIMYSFWLVTSYNWTSFMLLVDIWLMIFVSICFCAYAKVNVLGTCNTCKKRGFPSFPLTHSRMNQYLYIRDGFLALTNIIIVNLTHPNIVQHVSFTIAHVMIFAIHEKTQIIHGTHIKKWRLSPCHREVWLSSF
jgi:hypothetical protein